MVWICLLKMVTWYLIGREFSSFYAHRIWIGAFIPAIIMLFKTNCLVSNKSWKLTGSVLVIALGQYGKLHISRLSLVWLMKGYDIGLGISTLSFWHICSGLHSQLCYMFKVISVTMCIHSCGTHWQQHEGFCAGMLQLCLHLWLQLQFGCRCRCGVGAGAVRLQVWFGCKCGLGAGVVWV
jgi:hypothetical protein